MKKEDEFPGTDLTPLLRQLPKELHKIVKNLPEKQLCELLIALAKEEIQQAARVLAENAAFAAKMAAPISFEELARRKLAYLSLKGKKMLMDLVRWQAERVGFQLKKSKAVAARGAEWSVLKKGQVVLAGNDLATVFLFIFDAYTKNPHAGGAGWSTYDYPDELIDEYFERSNCPRAPEDIFDKDFTYPEPGEYDYSTLDDYAEKESTDPPKQRKIG